MRGPTGLFTLLILSLGSARLHAQNPIPLDPLTVEIARRNMRNAATYEGLYVRRETALPVGGERIVVLGDPELEHATRVGDVMRWFSFGMTPSRRACVDYYVNGNPRAGFDILNIPASLIEGIEYYVDGRFAPHGFNGGACAVNPNAFRYSIVAVWYRRGESGNL